MHCDDSSSCSYRSKTRHFFWYFILEIASYSALLVQNMNIIFISGTLPRARNMLLAPRIVKYVNMYSRATGIESQSTKGTQVFTQPARGSNAPFTDASSRTSRECVCSFHGSLRVAERPRREAAAKRIRCGRRIQPRQLSARSARARACALTDLCLPRDPGAIKSDISGGGVYRDSAKSAPRRRPVALIKTGP